VKQDNETKQASEPKQTNVANLAGQAKFANETKLASEARPDNEALSRRQFLAYGASSVAFLAHGLNKPDLSISKNAIPTSVVARSLVLIHLSGGNDGFNTLVPYTEKKYYAARPNLALRGSDVIKLDDRFALNSALPELAQLYREGVVAIFPTVGCEENLTKSHLRASKIWETASPDEQWKTGWHERLRPAVGSVSKIVLDGFDTHVDQRAQHFAALRQLSLKLEKLRPQLENTVVLVYSEFGRSLEENATLGTDHGSIGLCFALGAAVKGGIYTAPTTFAENVIESNSDSRSRNQSDRGCTTIDFRSLYGTIASDWFKCNPKAESLASSSLRINFLTT